MSSTVTQPESERSPWCSICYETADEAADKTLLHVLEEHLDHPEVQAFIDQLRVGQYCRKCGEWYTSGVEWRPSGVFTAPPYCEECRNVSRALKNLMTERIPIPQLLDRAWLEDNRE